MGSVGLGLGTEQIGLCRTGHKVLYVVVKNQNSDCSLVGVGNIHLSRLLCRLPCGCDWIVGSGKQLGC